MVKWRNPARTFRVSGTSIKLRVTDEADEVGVRGRERAQVPLATVVLKLGAGMITADPDLLIAQEHIERIGKLYARERCRVVLALGKTNAARLLHRGYPSS